jgi:hypothetical protein
LNTSITKSEKEALEELFMAMKERENLIERLQTRRKNMIRLMIRILKTVLTKQKITKQY